MFLISYEIPSEIGYNASSNRVSRSWIVLGGEYVQGSKVGG